MNPHCFPMRNPEYAFRQGEALNFDGCRRARGDDDPIYDQEIKRSCYFTSYEGAFLGVPECSCAFRRSAASAAVLRRHPPRTRVVKIGFEFSLRRGLIVFVVVVAVPEQMNSLCE